MKQHTLRTAMTIVAGIWMLYPGFAFSGEVKPADSISLSDQEMEQFLLTAEVVRKHDISTGITGTTRLTLSDGKITHDAHLQCVDISMTQYTTPSGTEFNFRDSYKYNVAAYKVDRLLRLGMVPVSVFRKLGGQSCAVTWWADNVQMMETQRYEKKMKAPNLDDWNDQMYQVRVFNELVYNTDPNTGNLLITNDWKIRLVDFTRAFRTSKDLRIQGDLVRIDRRLYDGLKGMDANGLKDCLGKYLTNIEIRSLMARRDKIVEFFDGQIAQKGEAAVICNQEGH